MRKQLLLTCLLTLVAAFGMAQSATWPIVITKADGLPGKYAGANYGFTTELYKLDEAVSTLRMTVVSTNTVEASENLSGGLSSGWGTGFPFMGLAELRVLDAAGNSIAYTATSNAAASNEGPIANINNGYIISPEGGQDYFHSTYSRGGCPQAYHYVEMELSSPVSEFQLEWYTRFNYHQNMPTYVGITAGSEFLPFPEQNFVLGEQVTSAEAFAAEDGLFVIESNAPEYLYPDFDREEPTEGGFYHSPYGAAKTASAASVVRLVPDAEKDGAYKIMWVNNLQYIANTEIAEGNASAWLQQTPSMTAAASFEFAACDSVAGDFYITSNNGQFILAADALGKMRVAVVTDTLDKISSRPQAFNFTIYKASIDGAAIASQLQSIVDEAEAMIQVVGGETEYDEGQYSALTTAIEAATAAMANAEVTASEVLSAKYALETALPAYAALGINVYADSLDAIIAAIDAGEIILSEGPEWVEGSYPMGSDEILADARDAALVVFDTYQSVADVNAGIDAAIAAIDAFWASKIANVKALPFRIGTAADGLPGEKQSYGGWFWESSVYNLTEATEVLRFTFVNTNSGAKYSGTQFVFPTIAELQLFDAMGNQFALTEENFTTNSVVVGDGQGLAGLCDNNTGTYYHAAWSGGQDSAYSAAPTYVYVEVSLPEAISSFKYVQYGRSNGVNTPSDIIISAGGEAITPDEVALEYGYSVELGEKVTDPVQIVDGEFYAIQGLYSCDPVHCFGEEPEKPHFFSGSVVYGNTLAAPAVFQITKTGDEDGSFYIRSIKDGSYWRGTTEASGWGSAGTTKDVAEAAKVLMTPRNNDGLPGSLVLYEKNDTVHRDVDGTDTSTPYLIFQDWGSDLASFSVTSLEANDADGEGEWYIYKVSMDAPHCYWLSEMMPEADKYKNLQVGPDPGYYSQESAGAFAAAYAQAKAAMEKNDDAAAKSVIEPLAAALETVASAATNPVTAGIYVFETAYATFMENQGVSKAIFSFQNNAPTNQYIGHLPYKLYWGTYDAPSADEAHTNYLFELIPATGDSIVAQWRAANTISVTDSINAFYIKSVNNGCYLVGAEDYSRPIGLSTEPLTPWIVRSQGDYAFDIFSPCGTSYLGYRSLHLGGHGGGTGNSGDIVTWAGNDGASKLSLRKATALTSIGGAVINGSEKGDVLVSTSYYTVGGAAVAAPVKGINIVKKVYANGVVESSKIYVK